MYSPYYFIIKPIDDRRYDNIRKYGDVDFIISTSQEDHTTSNRFAEVISIPYHYDGPVKPGDVVVVHHNVFKYYYDMKGRQKSSWNHVMDNTFLAENEQIYMYFRHGKFNAISPFCFVKPIPSEDKVISHIGKNEELWGELVYSNKDLEGVSEGDIVSFTPDSEYEFRINGEILYRMFNRNICLKR